MSDNAKRMLVIDDEPVVLSSVQRIFSEQGYEVKTADNPRAGLEMATECSYEVILCDWRMPDVDGIDVVEMLDKRCPEAAIVMITGFPAIERATEAVKRGAVDYLAKPFTPEEIISAVNKALRRKEQDRQKATGAVEKIVRSLTFPVPSADDPTPKTIAETVAQKVGVGKTTSPWLSVLVLGVLAGAYIAFGAMLATTVTFDLAAKMGLGFTKFMAGAVFSLGLMLVVIAGGELFTGNNLMISSAISGQISFGRMLVRWALVYGANFAGAILLALLFVFSGLWSLGDGALGAAAVKTAYGKVTLSFLQALLRGVGCNWLVCLAVWMALASRHTVGKIFAIFFPIMGFVALGFEHSVANMYFIPTGLLLREVAGIAAPSGTDPAALSWLSFLWRNLLPVTIGNIIGGAVFVGMSYWSAFLRPEKRA
jgi:formate/nitrite transporter